MHPVSAHGPVPSCLFPEVCEQHRTRNCLLLVDLPPDLALRRRNLLACALGPFDRRVPHALVVGSMRG